MFMSVLIRTKFKKTGEMKYISHLDLMRVFGRALRRAGFFITITKGFNRHFKISIDRALKLGIESCDEHANIYIEEEIDSASFIKRFNDELPDGISVLAASIEGKHA